MIYIGTSGFSYKDWVGVFYPAGLPQTGMAVLLCPGVQYLRDKFDLLRHTQCGYLKSRWRPRPEDGFLFAIKANQEMTHQRVDSASICEAFRQMLEPLIDSR